MSKRRKRKDKKVLRCMVCRHMFEVTEDNTYYLDGKEIHYCTNCGTDRVK